MCLPKGDGVKVEREWVHAGLQCAVTLTAYGAHRCGYVRVPPGHPLHGKLMHHPELDGIMAHGCVNFAEIEPCSHDDGTGWWFGFDCSHAWDARFDPNADPAKMSDFTRELMKIYSLCPSLMEGHYWTEPEVAVECERLAEQLAEVSA
jgi:hypothetical protein